MNQVFFSAGFLLHRDLKPEFLPPYSLLYEYSQQFDLYMTSMKIEAATWRDIYKDSLFSRICKIVAHELEELGLKDDAKDVKEQDENLRK